MLITQTTGITSKELETRGAACMYHEILPVFSKSFSFLVIYDIDLFEANKLF